MRYRAQDANGDYVFQGASPFLINSPATVAQAILTRVKLYKGEWFLDQTIGLDKDQILGYGTQTTRDTEIQRIILQTTGVTALTAYSSTYDPIARAFTVNATVETAYGQAILEVNF